MSIALAMVCCASFAQTKLTVEKVAGVYKPGIEHGKLDKEGQEKARKYKAAVANGSMKLHKDKTFGVSIAGRVMVGTWSISGDVITIHVKEIVGMTEKQVKNLPASEREGKFKVLENGKLVSMPIPAKGQPTLVWKKLP
jgi:hypothetical protein